MNTSSTRRIVALAVHAIFLIWLAGLCPCVLAQDLAQDTVGSGHRPHPDLGFFDAALVNCQAWRQADVLVKETVNLDSTSLARDGVVSGKLVRNERWDRIIFDLDKSRFAWFSHRVESTTEFLADQDKPVVTSGIRQECWICNDDMVGTFHVVNGTPVFWRRKDYAKDEAELLKKTQVPDLRLLWVVNRLIPYSRDPVDVLSGLRAGIKFESASERGDTVRLLFRSHGIELPVEVEGMFREFSFDTRTSNPTGTVYVYKMKNGTTLRGEQAEIEWDDRNGIAVPVALHQQRNRLAGEEMVDMELQWLSLNQPLEESVFSLDQLKAKDLVVKMIDVGR